MTSRFTFFATLAAGSAILTLTAYSFLWLAGRITNYHTTLAALDEKIAVLETRRLQARRGEQILTRRIKDFERVKASFVSRARPVALVEYVENLAVRTGNTLVLEIIESAPPDELALRLTAEGAVETVQKFVQLIELMPYQISIDELIFQRLDGALAGSASVKTGASPLSLTGHADRPHARVVLNTRVAAISQ